MRKRPFVHSRTAGRFLVATESRSADGGCVGRDVRGGAPLHGRGHFPGELGRGRWTGHLCRRRARSHLLGVFKAAGLGETGGVSWRSAGGKNSKESRYGYQSEIGSASKSQELKAFHVTGLGQANSGINPRVCPRPADAGLVRQTRFEGGNGMARWQPRTPKESLEVSLERIKTRIDGKKQEIKELEDQRKQVEQAIRALTP